MPEITDPAERIEKLLTYHTSKFSRVFLDAVSGVKSAIDLKQIADLLEANRFEEALQVVGKIGLQLGTAYSTAFSAAATATAKWLSEEALDVNISFNQVNARAVQSMQQNQLRLIREFMDDQRVTLRGAMTQGVQDGLNPVDQAKLFRDSIGLTRYQERNVANYERQLRLIGTDEGSVNNATRRALHDKRFNRTLAAAAKNGQPLTEKQIAVMTERYRERYIAYRAKVIARTEALRAVNQATEEMYLQAIEAGEIDAGSLERRWVTAKDERVRSSHAALNGQKKKIGEPWITANGPLYFPGDPRGAASETVQCRCVLSTTFKL